MLITDLSRGFVLSFNLVLTSGNIGWPPCSAIVFMNSVSNAIPAGSKVSLIFLVDRKCLTTFTRVPFFNAKQTKAKWNVGGCWRKDVFYVLDLI